MEVKYGAEVIDKNDVLLGTVDHLMHNTWTGELSKFVVRRKAPESDFFIPAYAVLQATEAQVKLGVSLDELAQSSL